jgi:hypothetical protein
MERGRDVGVCYDLVQMNVHLFRHVRNYGIVDYMVDVGGVYMPCTTIPLVFIGSSLQSTFANHTRSGITHCLSRSRMYRDARGETYRVLEVDIWGESLSWCVRTEGCARGVQAPYHNARERRLGGGYGRLGVAGVQPPIHICGSIMYRGWSTSVKMRDGLALCGTFLDVMVWHVAHYWIWKCMNLVNFAFV